jgi:hypothetical protein
MKTLPVITAIALSLLAGGTLNAQTNSPTLIEQWRAVEPTSSEATALKDAALALDTLSNDEWDIVLGWHWANGQMAAFTNTVLPAIAPKSPRAAAVLKGRVTFDATGWTDAMLTEGKEPAFELAMRPSTPQAFKTEVWNRMQGRVIEGPERGFWKAQRAVLPKQAQLALTAQQKDLLLAVPTRTDEQNAWLAEVSADLIALSLDQTQ